MIFLILLRLILVANMMIYLNLDHFIFVDAAVDSLCKLQIILVHVVLDFYVLVVHGQPTDSLPSG